MSNLSSKPYHIGYALAPKKEKTFILPSLLSHASQNGIILTKIDLTKPLTQQGAFDCILHNRISMLETVSRLKIMNVGVPKQITVTEEKDSENLKLNFPLIVKPLDADDGETSHNMHLVVDEDGLKDLTAMFILQEFVNHGNVVFKVYVAGKYNRCAKRKSLLDTPEEKMGSLKGSVPFSQVSNMVGGKGCDFQLK